jgi:hypothetical protein
VGRTNVIPLLLIILLTLKLASAQLTNGTISGIVFDSDVEDGCAVRTMRSTHMSRTMNIPRPGASAPRTQAWWSDPIPLPSSSPSPPSH